MQSVLRDRRAARSRGHSFDAIATHLGTAYLRNAFTKGTEQEVEFLVGALGLEPGMRVPTWVAGPAAMRSRSHGAA